MIEIKSRGEEVKLQSFDEKRKAGSFLGEELLKDCLTAFCLVSLSSVDFNE
jgi:hypothetical protein